jgi:hypothetical protein
MMRFIFTALLLFPALFVVMRADLSAGQTKPVAAQNSREEAERLWEQAIAAKGGRERLYSISNLQLSVRDKQWWEFRRVPYEVERLYVFPGKSWEWNDQTGSIFGFVIWMRNYEQGIHWTYLDNGKRGTVLPYQDQPMYRGAMSIIINAQLNYLMETRWVKPIPVSVERGKVGRHAVDIVRTVVREYPKGEESVSFALDRKSHLPRKVIYHTVVFGKEYSGGLRLSDYAELNGIQMPGKVGRDRTIYQFNVDYNQQVFEVPPSREAGIDAWKKKQ